MNGDVAAQPVVTVGDVPPAALGDLLDRFGLVLRLAEAGGRIPGSFWGEPEAGIIGRTVHARADTPLHSLLHETCHVICMSAPRRASLSGDAGGDDLEEAAVCYMQILLADLLPGVGRAAIMRDMDTWGYSFRLGSARSWFAQDAGDARGWLQRAGLIDGVGRTTFRLRAA